MAERGEGQERGTAKRYLRKAAEDKGLDVESLADLAKKTDPYFEVSGHDRVTKDKNLKVLEEGLMQLAIFLKEAQKDLDYPLAITRETAIAYLDQVCDQLKII